MYERRNHPLLSRAKFARRVARHLLLALFIIGIALGIGVLGYHCIGGLSWIDSLLNASMILGGMGPVDQLQSNAAKLFAFVLCVIFGTRFHRYRIAHGRPICAPAFAPLSRRREVKIPQLLIY